MDGGIRIALLGAESTGKSTLAHDLAMALRAGGRRVAVVPEALRAFCDRHGRTPQAHEQAGIARAQSRRIEDAAAAHEVVIADTTALMVAVYSALLFDDDALLAPALAELRGFQMVLLTALDLPWVADGLQRDGPHVRGPVDARLRRSLREGGVAFSVIHGEGTARVRAALAAISTAWPGAAGPIAPSGPQPRPACGLFTGLLAAAPVAAQGGWICDCCDVPELERRSLYRDG